MTEQGEKLRDQARSARAAAVATESRDAARLLGILADEYEAEAEKLDTSQLEPTLQASSSHRDGAAAGRLPDQSFVAAEPPKR